MNTPQKVRVKLSKKGLTVKLNNRTTKRVTPIECNPQKVIHKKTPVSILSKVIEFLQTVKSSESIRWRAETIGLRLKSMSSKGSKASKEIAISVTAALVVGAVMGVTILNVFFSQPLISSASNRVYNSERRVFTPNFNAVLLQAASLSTLDKAEQIKNKLTKSGLSAVVGTDKPYSVYVGVTGNRDNALKLSSFFINKNVDIYIKDFSNTKVSLPNRSGYSSLISVLDSGAKILLSLNDKFRQKDLGNLSAAKKINESVRVITSNMENIEPSLLEKDGKKVRKMRLHLQKALECTKGLTNKTDDKLLMTLQSSVLGYIVEYEDILNSWK